MKTAVSTVIYKWLEESFIKDFLESLTRQTDQNFDLQVIAQECSQEYIKRLVNAYAPVLEDRLLIVETSEKEADYDYHKLIYLNNKRRYETLRENGYDYVIGIDSDDIAPDTHIETMKSEISDLNADVICCDLNKFGTEYSTEDEIWVFGNILEHGHHITYELLRTGNCCGFGNTISNVEKVHKAFEQISSGNECLDWTLFTLITKQGGIIRHTKNSYIDYRIHDKNMSYLHFGDYIRTNLAMRTISNHFSQAVDTHTKVPEFDELPFDSNKALEEVIRGIDNTNNHLWWERNLKIYRTIMANNI